MNLKVGDVRRFRTFDGRFISGKVVAVINRGVYLVVGDGVICHSYIDGLFRFTTRNIA